MLSGRHFKILFSGFRPCYPFFVGGDGLIIHFLLSGLAKVFNCDCKALGAFAPKAFPYTTNDYLNTLDNLGVAYNMKSTPNNAVLTYKMDGYPSSIVRRKTLIQSLAKEFDIYKPDLLITTEEDAEFILYEGKKRNIPSILIAQHAEYTDSEMSLLSENASAIVFVSNFLLNKYLPVIKNKTKAVTIYDPFDWSRWIVQKHNRKYISMLNPLPHKGGDIFLELAKLLPDRLFLAKGGAKAPDTQSFNLPNLMWEPRILWDLSNNMGMKFFMENTRILLVPSRWEDSMPSIIMQALKNGIPVIGSNRGGIPEAIGTGGIVVNKWDDISSWIDAIKQLDHNNQQYNSYVERAFISGSRFSYDVSLQHYYELITKLV